MADRPVRLPASATLRERWDIRFKGEGPAHGSAFEIHDSRRCRARLSTMGWDVVRHLFRERVRPALRIDPSMLLEHLRRH